MEIVKEAAAYNEAGHAVVAYLLGRSFEAIDIIPEGDVKGHFWGYSEPKPSLEIEYENNVEKRKELDKAILILLGGHYAKKVFLGSNHVNHNSDDYQRALRLARFIMVGKTDEEYVQELYANVKNLISNNWEVVVNLSTLLLQKETINYSECVRTIQETIQGKAD